MFKLLHVSDLHFGPPFLTEIGEAVLDMAHRLTPDLVVVSGDFTQRAKREQFRQARDWLERLPAVPRVVVPGNHDVPLYRVWERLTTPYKLYREYIHDRLDYVLTLDQAVVVALNSTEPYRAISNGRIRTEQLEYCESCFAQAPDEAARIVVAHHHFAPAPDYDGGETMPKAKRALDRFTRLRVDLIMAGHLHRAYIGNSLDVYSGEDREHGIIIAQCGTTTSRRGRAREREKNSFHWIELDTASTRVLHYMFFDEARGFSPVAKYEFARPSRGFLYSGVPDAPIHPDYRPP